MANWYGAARSNYVLIKDLKALVDALDPWPISIHKKHKDDSDNNVLVCFLSEDQDSGGWPSTTWDEDDNEIEFDAAELICPHLVEGQVLVMMEAGAEKLRYITGQAVAFNHEGDYVAVNLNDIYEAAAGAFDVSEASITRAEY